MLVVANAVRAGAELCGDLGLEQNTIHNPQGNDEVFLNTALTLQISRGIAVSALCGGLSPLFASLYGLPTQIFLAISAAPLFNSLASTSIFSLSRQLDVKKRNLFELCAEVLGLAINVALIVAVPGVWAPILGVLLTLLCRAYLSHLLPHPPHRLIFHPRHIRSIFLLSRWVMLSSLAFYASQYIDRLFLGRTVALSVLGVYGLAKTIADLPPVLAARLGYQIVFPVVAADMKGEARSQRSDLLETRGRFLLLVAVGTGTVMAWSNWAVAILYGGRYKDAGWMLFLLLFVSWAGVLSAFNEAAVMGRAKPHFASLAQIVRFVVLAGGLPAGFAVWGLAGAIVALLTGEAARYIILALSQRRMAISFARQDALVSAHLLAVLACWLGVRILFDLGMPWKLIS